MCKQSRYFLTSERDIPKPFLFLQLYICLCYKILSIKKTAFSKSHTILSVHPHKLLLYHENVICFFINSILNAFLNKPLLPLFQHLSVFSDFRVIHWHLKFVFKYSFTLNFSRIIQNHSTWSYYSGIAFAQRAGVAGHGGQRWKSWLESSLKLCGCSKASALTAPLRMTLPLLSERRCPSPQFKCAVCFALGLRSWG